MRIMGVIFNTLFNNISALSLSLVLMVESTTGLNVIK
jgi:hypothetical protein